MANPIFQPKRINPADGAVGARGAIHTSDLSGLAAIAAADGRDVFAEAAAAAKEAGAVKAAEDLSGGGVVPAPARPAVGSKGYIYRQAYYNTLTQGNLAAAENQLDALRGRVVSMLESGVIADRESALKLWEQGSAGILESLGSPENKAAIGIVIARTTSDLQAARQSIVVAGARRTAFNEKIDRLNNAAANITPSNWHLFDNDITSEQSAYEVGSPMWNALEKMRADGNKILLESATPEWARQQVDNDVPFGDIEKGIRAVMKDAPESQIDALVDGARLAAYKQMVVNVGADYTNDIAHKVSKGILTAEEAIEDRRNFGLLAPVKFKGIYALAKEGDIPPQQVTKDLQGEVSGTEKRVAAELKTAAAMSEANDAAQAQEVLKENNKLFDKTNAGSGYVPSGDEAAAAVKNAEKYGGDDGKDLERAWALDIFSKTDARGRPLAYMWIQGKLGGRGLDAITDEEMKKEIADWLPVGTRPQKDAIATHIGGFIRNAANEGNAAILEQGADAARVDENIKVLFGGGDANEKLIALAEIDGVRFSQGQASAMTLANDMTEDPAVKMKITSVSHAGGGGGTSGEENMKSAARYLKLPFNPNWDDFAGVKGMRGDYMEAWEKGYRGTLAGLWAWGTWEARRQVGDEKAADNATRDSNIRTRRKELLEEKGLRFDPVTNKLVLPLVRGREDAAVLESKLLRDGGYVGIIAETLDNDGNKVAGTIDPATTHTENGSLLELMKAGNVFVYEYADEQDGNFLWKVFYRDSRAEFVLDGEPVFVAVDKRVHTGSYMPDPEMPDEFDYSPGMGYSRY